MSVIRNAAILRARTTHILVPSARATNVLLWLMVGVNVLFLSGLIASGGKTNPVVNVGLGLATQWVPVAIFWLVAWRTGFGRVGIVLAAAGVTLSALGDSYYSLAMDADGYLAFPSPADAGYLLFYPLMVAALVVLVRRHLIGAGGMVLLEFVVAAVGASATLALVLDPLIGDALANADGWTNTVAVAYPLFDLLLLAVIAGVASVPSFDFGSRWWALIVGLGIFATADVAYALLEHEGTYLAGTPLDAAWAVGLAFMTWWVVGFATPQSAAESRPPRTVVIPVPAIAVVAGLAVLVIGTQMPISTLAIILAGLTVGLAAVPIIFRQAMLGRLLAAQKEAVTQLLDLDRGKSDMMVTLNHEIRTPLTSINGFVEVLLDGDAGDIPPTAVGMLRAIESNGARLQDLVDDMLTVSELETGRNLQNRRPLYVSGLLSRSAALVRPLAKSRGIALETTCDNFALVVDADGNQLERALVSLIDNAVKFTPKGGRVDVTAEGPTRDGEIIVTVTDTGMGIPAEDMPRLFTRFFRASNVQNAAIAGAGLGLPIAKRAVEYHDGSISVESVLGEGTTVTVRLPVSATGVLMPRPGA